MNQRAFRIFKFCFDYEINQKMEKEYEVLHQNSRFSEII
jgi:hypothetical protein